jgi:hypothetical protein
MNDLDSDLFVILTFQLKGEGLKEGEQLPKEVFTETSPQKALKIKARLTFDAR